MLLATKPHLHALAGVGRTHYPHGAVSSQHGTVGQPRRQLQSAVISRQRTSHCLGQDGGSRSIGMQIVGKQVGPAVQRRVEVDELCPRSGGHLRHACLYLGMPIARAAGKATVAVEDGRQAAHPHADRGIDGAKRVDQGAVVPDKIIAILRPVARVGIVESQVHDNPVRTKGQRGAKLLHLHVGAVAAPQERRPGMTEVAHFKLRAKQAPQLCRIGQAVTAGDAVTIGHAIAHTGHAHSLLPRRCSITSRCTEPAG